MRAWKPQLGGKLQLQKKNKKNKNKTQAFMNNPEEAL